MNENSLSSVAASSRNESIEVFVARTLGDTNGHSKTVQMTPEMAEYIALEARTRGVSELAVYEEEMAAKMALDALGDDEEFLARAEAKSRWPEKIDDEPKPF